MMRMGIGTYGYGADQDKLGAALFPQIKKGVLAYINDSYRCK